MNLVQRLKAELSKRRWRILVIGDAMIDHWIHGHLADSQDGCQKFVEESRCETPGGAANAARSLEIWAADVDLFGWTGKDRPEKWRFVADNKIVFRWDDEARATVHAREAYRWAYSQALEMVPYSAAVLLSDYDKAFMTTDFIKEIVKACQAIGIPCVADAKREPAVYKGAIIKGNESYWTRYASPVGSRMVMTRGAGRPMTGHADDNKSELTPVECVNHCGAGDCFAAHLTLALACEFSLEDAAAVAHSAGRVYVQHPHNQPPWPHKIREDMEHAQTQDD